MSWVEKAACQSADHQPHWWDGEDEPARRKAMQVCWQECPVRPQCLDAALERREPAGIWGGRSANQRHRILAGRGIKPGHSAKPSAPPKPRVMVSCHCGRKVREGNLDEAGWCGPCRLNARRRAEFEDRLRIYADLHVRGCTRAEIAAELGLHPATMNGYARAARDRGLLMVPSRTRARLDRVARAQQMGARGLTAAQIAAELGVTTQSVYRYLDTTTAT